MSALGIDYSMNKLRLLCHVEIAPYLQQALQDYRCEVVHFSQYTERDILAGIDNTDILVSWLATSKIIESATNLRFIQSWSAGVDQIDLEQAERKGVVVAKLSGANAQAVAEFTISAMVAYNRKICLLNDIIKHGGWGSWNIRQNALPRELGGKVLGILGYGAVGREVSRKAAAFGMKVFAIKRTPLLGENHNADFVGGTADLGYVLRKSDFISINLPLTPQTRHILSHDQFGMMKEEAILVNSSRGEVIDQVALQEALGEHRIAGAIIDVYSREPISRDSPLLGLDNVLLTPHVSGYTVESREMMIKMTAANIVRVLTNHNPMNQVDFEAGY
jgi:phosphoglycerate dehydrogenase-like enzyme